VGQELALPAQEPTMESEGFQLPEDSIPFATFNMEVGMSAFTNFEGMYGFNTYVAPQWSVQPFKKIQLTVMPYMGRTNYYNVPNWGYTDATKLTFDQNMMNFGLSVQGAYLINDRLYSGASVFIDTHMPESNTTGLDGLNNYGASAFVGYKFSDKFSMQASFGVSKYPSYYSPSPGLMPMHPRNPYNRF